LRAFSRLIAKGQRDNEGTFASVGLLRIEELNEGTVSNVRNGLAVRHDAGKMTILAKTDAAAGPVSGCHFQERRLASDEAHGPRQDKYRTE
jgi:hypothetical protein